MIFISCSSSLLYFCNLYLSLFKPQAHLLESKKNWEANCDGEKEKGRTFWVDIDNIALMEPLRHSWAKPHQKAWYWRNDFSESTSSNCPIQQSHQTTSPAHPSLWRLEACFVLLPMEESLMSTTPTLCIFHHLTRPKPASFSLYTSPFTSLPSLPLSRCLQNMIWYFTILLYFKWRKVYLSYNVAY